MGREILRRGAWTRFREDLPVSNRVEDRILNPFLRRFVNERVSFVLGSVDVGDVADEFLGEEKYCIILNNMN